MLVVFQTLPFAAPFEAMTSEQPIAEVTATNLVIEVPTAVSVWLSGGRLNTCCAVASLSDAGVIKWVYIDGHAPTVG